MKLKYTILCALISFNLFAQRSILNDKAALEKIERGLDSIYNLQFDSVLDIEEEFINNYPNNPLPPLFSALRIYWEYFPITPNSKYNDLYIGKINESIEKAEKILDKDENNHEAQFLNLMARLLIMQYYADNRQSAKVIPYVRRAYNMARKGFNLTDEIVDFNFSTGLYNYYREAYPEKHPVYKPIAYFFKDGDKKLGFKQLEYNSKHGIFLDAESLSFLVYISLNFEENYKKASKYTKELNQLYPNNLLYLSYRIKTYLLNKKYIKAQELIVILDNSTKENGFFQIIVKIYQGIIEEKKNKNYKKAEILYNEAIKCSKEFEPFINNRISYAYFGLSRIYKQSDPKKSKELRNIAKEISSYKHITFD